MKILLFSDNHFCERYSLVNRYGSKYTMRLENQIKTMNWVEAVAKEENCDAVFCLGDFFDKPQITAQEITALREVVWNDLPHYFIVGNHESGDINLQYSSTKALENKNRHVISTPTKLEFDSFDLLLLPYITESDRKPLKEYFIFNKGKKQILLSHNDLKDIDFGMAISKQGFTLEEIDEAVDICFNGHLHNGPKATDKIINMRDITGKDFGENAFKYPHDLIILDTDTLAYKYLENPHALNFYKLEVSKTTDLNVFDKLKGNAVISVKCINTLVEQVREAIKQHLDKIIESRVTVCRLADESEATTLDVSDLSMDHLAKFYEMCTEKIENTPLLKEELAEVLK